MNRMNLGRKTRANKLDVLQKDTGLWNATQEIASFMAGKSLALLTSQDFADFLGTIYSQVNVTVEAVYYQWYWDEVHQMWYRVCHSGAAISMTDDPAEDPIVLTLDDTATYM